MNLKLYLQKITGLSPKAISYCGEASQNKIMVLGAIMLFTAFVSAGFMSYAISVLCFHSKITMPVVFLAWFIFVYLFERLIIAGKNIRKSSILVSRLAAALVFALVHSLVIDTLFFQKDIISSFDKEKISETSVIQSTYENKIENSNNRLTELRKNNRELTDQIKSLNEQIIAEVDGSGGSHKQGFGPIYELKKQSIDPQIASIKELIKKNEDEIVSLQQNMKNTEFEKAERIAMLPKYSDKGLLENIRQLHKITLIDGDFTSRFFLVLWFCIFVFIESLPLLAKLTLEIPDYYKADDKILAGRDTVTDIKINRETQVESEKELALTTNAIAKNHIEVVLDKMKIQMEGLEKSQYLLFEHLKNYDAAIISMRKNYPDYIESHILPLFAQNNKDIQLILNQIKISTP
ncbi:MAG: DUF4407 domain-containing protein [Bacteroidales bacterium]|nr:DUF4407 domain-containing protein [Bacteroidales bacterium]